MTDGMIPQDGEPLNVSARKEGRVRACEGLMRQQLGWRECDAGQRALRILRGESVEERIVQVDAMVLDRVKTQKLQPVTRLVTPITPHASVPNSRSSIPSQMRTTAKPKFLVRYGIWATGAAAALLVGMIGLYLAYAIAPVHSQSVRIGMLDGNARVVSRGNLSRAAVAGEMLLPGESIITSSNSSVMLVYQDGTSIDLPGDSWLKVEDSEEHAKAVMLEKGLLTAKVRKQPENAPMIVATKTARVDVLGTSFTVAAQNSSTELDVDHGKVRFTRNSDSSSVQVAAGFNALAAPGVELKARPLQFIRGINFGGHAVTIEGNRWLGHDDALRNGLTLPKLSRWDWPKWQMTPKPDQDTIHMLQSGIWTNESMGDEPLTIRQTLPNGEYKIYLWSVENAHNFMRSLTIQLQGKTAATGISALPQGQWGKYGPFSAKVTDSLLTLTITGAHHNNGERHICGMAIFKLNE